MPEKKISHPGHGKNSAASPTPNPFAAPPLRLPGFTPLVETAEDGSLLSRLEECHLTLPWEECLRHTLVIGKTGAGKTMRLILRTIFASIRNPEMSLVVVDAQRTEEERIIRYARAVRGPKTRIMRLNWLDPERSTHYWNCLDSLSSKADCYEIASSLTSSLNNVVNGDSMYFRQQATQLLSGIFRALSATGHATLGMARQTLDGGSAALRNLARSSGLDDLIRFANEIDAGNRNTETTVAEATNHLIALHDERVEQTTSVSELQFQSLENEPTVFILSLDEEAVDRLRPLTNVFLHRLFSWIISAGREAGGPLKRPLAIFIDEFASAVGRLPDFERRAHTLRKRNAALFAAVQSTDQIVSEYREAAASVLAAFNHRILVPPVAESDANAAAGLSGMMQSDNITSNSTGSALSIAPLHRPLLLPQEIGSPERDPELGPRITFLLADTPPFQGWLRAAWEIPQEAACLKSKGVLPVRRRKLRRLPSPPTGPARDKTASATLRPGISNTRGWTPSAIDDRLDAVKREIGWEESTGSARKWWSEFERENKRQTTLVLLLAEEINSRSATISDFFLAYVYSNTDNLQAVLYYLDYSKAKKAAEAVSSENQLAFKDKSRKKTSLNVFARRDLDRMTDDSGESEPEIPYEMDQEEEMEHPERQESSRASLYKLWLDDDEEDKPDGVPPEESQTSDELTESESMAMITELDQLIAELYDQSGLSAAGPDEESDRPQIAVEIPSKEKNEEKDKETDGDKVPF